MKNILLLTATITPRQDEPFLARADPRLRRDDYEKAFQFYLPHVGRCLDSIVFAENSNADLSGFKSLVDRAGCADRVELLGCDGLDYPQVYGRGYGEFKLVDYAAAHAVSINAGHPDITVWKVSGRYLIRNLEQFIMRRPPAFDIYCNFRNIPHRWADMYLLAWTPPGYEAVLKGIYESVKMDVDNRTPPEVRFRQVIEQAPESVRVVPRFRVAPFVEGVRGFDNQDYAHTRNLWKFYARSAVQRLMPWLWI